jgi:hypothetical protein
MAATRAGKVPGWVAPARRTAAPALKAVEVMGQRPRRPLPGWKPTTGRQEAVLRDLLHLYFRHAENGLLPRSGRRSVY